MTRFNLIWVLLFCGCSFDFSLLRRDGGLSEVGDAMVDASDSGEDSGMLVDADDSGIEDAGVDSGIDAWVEPDAGEDAGSDGGPPALTCTDVPDIAGSYRITRRLRDCGVADYGLVLLNRLDACEYEFDDGVPEGPTIIFDGPCDVIILGASYSYECEIRHGVWRYRCTLEPVSGGGGLNIDCRFVGPPDPDPPPACSFFAPDE